jgi:hypothetical protein
MASRSRTVYKLLLRKADTVGDGSGSKAANGNYAVTPRILKIRAQPDEVIEIQRLIFSIVDGTINNYDVYAGAGLLTNGVVMYVTDNLGNIQYNLTDPDDPITNIGEWGHNCFDALVKPSQTSGQDHFVSRWTFARSGQPVQLLPGWSINVLLQDDFTALTEHNFLFHGYYLQPGIGNAAGHA